MFYFHTPGNLFLVHFTKTEEKYLKELNSTIKELNDKSECNRTSTPVSVLFMYVSVSSPPGWVLSRVLCVPRTRPGTERNLDASSRGLR